MMLEAVENPDLCYHLNSEHHTVALYALVTKKKTKNLNWNPKRNMSPIKVNICSD